MPENQGVIFMTLKILSNKKTDFLIKLFLQSSPKPESFFNLKKQNNAYNPIPLCHNPLDCVLNL